MLNLQSVGMEKGMLYETIITTINPDKTPNAAPIGVICKDKDKIVVYLHQGSRTVRNIKNNLTFTVNILRNPQIFVDSTIGDLNSDCYVESNGEYSIKGADAFFQAEIKDIKDIKDVERKDQFGVSMTTIVQADVGEIVINSKCVEPLNRAIYGVVEALVYLTRKDMVSGETEKLYNLRMKEISRIVNKVGSSEHKKAIKKVMEEWDQ